MALPGLNLTSPEVQNEVSVPSTKQRLSQGSEWRFEVAFGKGVEVKLTQGTAEIFGTELALHQTYQFNGTKAAIYTWNEDGCELEVTGECSVEYIAEETPMTSFVNTHFALEQHRERASMTGQEGPRVLVVGPDNAGKTSLVKMLTAYASKVGRRPVMVNLDPKEGALSLPGTLTATVMSSVMDVEEGWGSSPTSGPSPVRVKLPLVYHYGLSSPEEQPRLFKPVASRVALAVTSRTAEDSAAKEAGCIIDTAGVISRGSNNYDLINHIVSEFSVNVLLVLGSERLYSDMVRRYDGTKTSTDETISVVKLAKSGGCVDRDETYMEQARRAQLKEYFFGDAKRELSPHAQLVDFDQLHIYKTLEPSAVNTSLLPGGGADSLAPPDSGEGDEEEYNPADAFPLPAAQPAPSASIYEKVTTPTPMMQNSILAIMYANPTGDSQETIRDASVMGFVYVDEVDEKRRKVRLLAPMAGRLPTRPLVWGKWPEQVVDLS